VNPTDTMTKIDCGIDMEIRNGSLNAKIRNSAVVQQNRESLELDSAGTQGAAGPVMVTGELDRHTIKLG